VALEAFDPIVGPPFAIIAHSVGQEGLLGSELAAVHRAFVLGDKAFENRLTLAGFEAKDGGIANIRLLAKEGFAPREPVVDDAISARLIVEKLVQRAHDDLVDIEEQGRPLEVVEVVGCHCQLSPEAHFVALWHTFRQREGDGLDALDQPFRALGHADESEGSTQVFFDA